MFVLNFTNDEPRKTNDRRVYCEGKMPKLKTSKSVKKRMRVTKSGRIKHFRAGRGHLLTLKRSKRKRFMGKPGYVSKGEERVIKKLLPYGA